MNLTGAYLLLVVAIHCVFKPIDWYLVITFWRSLQVSKVCYETYLKNKES